MRIAIAARRRLARLRRRRRLRRLRRFLLRLILIAVIAPPLWVAVYAWVNPPITYLMVSEWTRLGEIERDWRDISAISPDLPHAVMGGEDARFCAHSGFDFIEIRKALAEEGRRRGASSLTQQVAKNAFLWPDANWVRKGLEAGFAVMIELFWSKRRIMEVYLNIAEWDEGVFGAEAAAQRYFGVSAADLTLRQASRLAAILPNPKGRNAAQPTPWLSRRAAAIADGAETLRRTGAAACIEPG
ncbi:MAG: monofunctional biosynthetic peptidoglycan transglycosylase [Pseudomonadota bacterium]